MCILVVAKAGYNMPTKEELKAMRRANPHGMGFASKTLSYKGMNFEAFYHTLMCVPKGENVIIHFRYATHGSICIKNCHPFKRGKMWFAHNGILDIKPSGDMTDSETAFKNILYPAAKKYGIHSDELRYKVSQIIGSSKFAFLDQKGDISMFGHFERYHGYWCSNLGFTYHLSIYNDRYYKDFYYA